MKWGDGAWGIVIQGECDGQPMAVTVSLGNISDTAAMARTITNIHSALDALTDRDGGE